MTHEKLGRLPLYVRARLAVLAGAEEEWLRGSGHPMTAAELRRVLLGLEVLPPAHHVPRVQADKASATELRRAPWPRDLDTTAGLPSSAEAGAR